MLTIRTAGGVGNPRSKLTLPLQLGCLQLDCTTDLDQSSTNQGWSAAYGGTGISCIVHVYDHGRPVSSSAIDSERFRGEFRSVVEQMFAAVPGLEHLDSDILPAGDDPQAAVLATFRRPDDQCTALLLFVSHGEFVKGRITWEAVPELRPLAMASMAALVDAVKTQHRVP